MRILLDECVNPRLRLAFPGDQVRRVAQMGWLSLLNGALLRQASPDFDVFVTLDQNLQYQNPVAKYPIGILVLVTRSNHIDAYRRHFEEIRRAAMDSQPGTVTVLRLGSDLTVV